MSNSNKQIQNEIEKMSASQRHMNSPITVRSEIQSPPTKRAKEIEKAPAARHEDHIEEYERWDGMA